MRGAATKAMSDIVEERQQRRYSAGYCSSLAPRQRAWGPEAKCEVISARALRIEKRAILGAFYVNSAFPQACRAGTCARPNIVFAQNPAART